MQQYLRSFTTTLATILLLLASSVAFGQATVTSDKDDYAPLSNAVFTGSGFAAFETVILKVKNLNQPCNTVTADSSYSPWSVVADENGAFVTNWTVCNCTGDSLRLKAVGQTSGLIAYAYFTDGNLNSVDVSAASQTVNYGTAAFVNYTVTVKTTGGAGTITVNLNATGLPAGVTPSWSSSSINISGAATVTVTLTLIVQNNTDVPVSPTFTVTGTAGATSKSNTGTLTINRQPVTGSITASNKVYDGNATATISLYSLTGVLFSDNVLLSGGTATFPDKNAGTNRTVTATGLTLSGSKAGNYILNSSTATTTASITGKPLTTVFSIADKVYDGNTSAIITDRQLVGIIGNDKVTLSGGTATFSDKNVGAGKTVTVVAPMSLAGVDAGNYSIGTIGASTASITFRTATINYTVSNKSYDGTTAATIASAIIPSASDDPLHGLITGDVVVVNFGSAVATFDSKDVASTQPQPVTASGFILTGADGPAPGGNGNYQVDIVTTFVATANITPLSITVTFTASNKIYDGSTSAAILTRTIVGAIAADAGKISAGQGAATFDTKHVGTAKTVTASGFVLTGSLKDNYVIDPNAATSTANITPRGLNVTARTDSRIYNGTTSSSVAPTVAPLQTGDVISTAPTQVYNNRNVGVAKTLTASGLLINDGNGGNNYTINYVSNNTGIITIKGISVTALTDSRVYNGTTSSVIAPVVDPLQTGDVIGTAPTQVYNNRNVGVAKTLTASGLVISDGNSGLNYSVSYVSNGTGVISIKGINVTAQTDSRVYNGTTSSGVAPVVEPLQTGDVIGTAAAQAYDNRNVGAGKTLTASGLVINDGNSGLNYNISYVSNSTGIISIRGINVTAQTNSRVYNGTTSSGSAPVVDPLQTGDAIGTAPTQSYDTRNVGTGKTLTASGLVISDGNGGNNYDISYVSNGTGIITIRDINVTAQTDSRVYNGTTSSAVAPVVDPLQTGDAIGTAAAQAYDNRNVGAGKTLAASGLVIDDGNSGLNYDISYISSSTGVISIRGINVTAQTDSRVYNGTTSSGVAPLVEPLQTGDAIGTAAAQAYDNRNVGAGKTLAASGLVISDGNGGNNYNINYVSNSTGVISIKGINVTAQTDSRVYNGTTSSGSAPVVEPLQSGDVIGIAPTQVYNNRNVGAGKTLTASGLVITDGNGGNNYDISYVSNGTGIISIKGINVTAQTDSRVYNGTTSSAVAPVVDPLQTGDVIGTAPTQVYNNRNVGAGKTLAASGLVINDGNSGLNYSVSYVSNGTGVISIRGINVTAQTDSRVYNGTTSSAVAPVVDPLQTGDVIGTAPTQVYNNRNVGTGKTIAASGLVINDGNSGLNYSVSYVSNGTGIITIKGINVTAQTDSRVYNGTTSSGVVPVVDPLQTGDIIGTPAVQAYNNRNVGSGKTLTASGLVINDGNSGLNYNISYVTNGTGIITIKGISVTAQTDSRVYNGTTSSVVVPVVEPLQTGDVIGTAPTQVYNNRNVGTGKTLAASGLVINDGNTGLNYNISYISNGTGVISIRGINVTAQTNTRIYNGTTSSAVVPVVDPLQTGDVIGTAPTQVYNNRNVGTGKTLAASGLVINDGNSGLNYNISYVSNGTGVITTRGINVTAQTDSRVYNGTTSSAVAPVVDPLQTGDAIGTVPTQVYNNRNVGTGKTLAASGLVINDGNSGLNYTVSYVSNSTGVITIRGINVTAQTNSRVYNGTTSSSIAPVVDPLQTGDVVGTAPIQKYDTKNVGTNKILTPSGLVITDGNSGLNYQIYYVTNATGIITTKGITGNITVANKIYDGNTSATIITRTLTGAIVGDDVSYSGGNATFNDIPVGTGKNTGNNKPVTAIGLSLIGADKDNYTVNTSATTTANITTANLTITADNLSPQYSDPVVFTVQYAGFVSGEGIANLGGSLIFTTTPSATTGSNPVIATGAPGNYTITPGGFTSSNYAIVFNSGVLAIRKEDAKITYTGITLVATTGTATTATLTLSATIQDITAALSDPAYDIYPGDIRNATVTFNIDGIDKATVPIGLVNGADAKTGTAVYNFAGAALGDHTIVLKLNGYYVSTASGDNQFVVEVYQATGDFITGGGYLNLTNSNGLKAGDAGTKNNFGFNIKYNKGGTNLQGTINTIVRRMEGGVLHIYQVKGNSMTSLTVNSTANPPTAVFNGKANVTDITNPLSPVSVGGNSTLQVSMTDAGEPGTFDKIGIIVFNNAGGMWFTSNWDGTKTVQQTLGGGNLIVHSSSNVGTTTARMTTVDAEPTPAASLSDKFIVKVYPTVSETYFTVNVQSNTADAVQIRIYDIAGRQVETARAGIGESTRVGHRLASGQYILTVSQGNNNSTIRVSKF